MPGINGGAVTLAAAGAYLVYAGIRNVPLLAGLRDLAAGRLPAPRPVPPTKVAFDEGTAGLSPAGSGGGPVQRQIDAGHLRYDLGAVKPHVEAAAYEIGPKFGIVTIYGKVPGLYDHPKGLALDFMIDSPGLGKPVGDAIVLYVLDNMDRLRMKYIIWYRQIYTHSEGWHPYTGTNSHTDHVHVSFEA